MTEEENELLLYDRLEAIKTLVGQVGQEHIYLSFSGGKDSTVVHHLLDMAIPNNKIKRVFINTGIEYQLINEFVKEHASKDDRFVIIQPTMPIKQMLEKYGYPFKSKEHSGFVRIYQNGNPNSIYVRKYANQENVRIRCPDILKYQFSPNFKLKISKLCCQKMKKDPVHKWAKVNDITCFITGLMRTEGGQRASNVNCIVKDKMGIIKSFNPIAKVSEEWEKWFIQKYNIQLCKLYYEPYNFQRTGCKGCPFALGLEEQLKTMELYMPNERKQCEMIWKPIYDEYRRLGYRLKKNEQGKLL